MIQFNNQAHNFGKLGEKLTENQGRYNKYRKAIKSKVKISKTKM